MNRLVELSQTNLVMDVIESSNKGERAFIEAEQYGWGIAEGTVPEHMSPIMNKQIQKGVKLNFLIPKNRLSANVSPPAMQKPGSERSLSPSSNSRPH